MGIKLLDIFRDARTHERLQVNLVYDYPLAHFEDIASDNIHSLEKYRFCIEQGIPNYDIRAED